MDNLTHTVIGLIAGEALARLTEPREEQSGATLAAAPITGGFTRQLRRRVYSVIGMIGGNLPDLDLLYTYRGRSAGKLTYLLGHRGYTHTVVGCLVLAALLFAGVCIWLKRSHALPARAQLVGLGAWCAGATGLHLMMDALNSYGVHPWWPFDDRWWYGDSVFIIEPLLWVAAVPLYFVLCSRAARIAIVLLVAAALALSLFTGMVPLVACAALAAVAGTLVLIGAYASARMASCAAAVALLLVVATFVAARGVAARQVETWAVADFPEDHVVDMILNPRPADPMCWDALVLETRGAKYFARGALLSLAPALIGADGCGKGLGDGPSTAPRSLPAIRDRSSVRWREFDMPSADLVAAARDDCRVAALWRFARAPYALRGAQKWTVGDLRFDREKGIGFAELEVPVGVSEAGAACPATEPWVPPREDILQR